MNVPVFTIAELRNLNRYSDLKLAIRHKRLRSLCRRDSSRLIPVRPFNASSWPVQPRCKG